MKTFEELGVAAPILKAIQELGYVSPMPVQEEVIPYLLGQDNDVIALAQTGTGKTASFGIPVLHKVDPNNKKTQVIILSPTRELAIQVSEEIRKLSKYMHGVKILPVYGGQDINRQIKALKGGAQIIIGTPGRVMDHLRRKTIRCEAVNTIVLDEADEMLNMGFREDIETILEYIPEEGRQTVLFSATMPKPILDITKKYQHDAVTIKVVKKELTVPSIEQYYYDVKRKDKTEVLTRLLDYYNPKLSLVFCNTKKMVDELSEELKSRGYMAEGLHGDLSQTQRDRVMKKFREGTADILIATDVAARGIDIDNITHVINFDIPQDPESYVHRIGRTGRAGNTGTAMTFITPREFRQLKLIERAANTKIMRRQLPTTANVVERQREIIISRMQAVLELNHYHDYMPIAETLLQDYASEDIIAAALKLMQEGNKALEAPKEEGLSKDLTNTGGRPGMVRFFMNIGRSQKISVQDIVRTIAIEADIPAKDIGKINIYDKFTFVEVPEDVAEKVLGVMHRNTIKGYKVNVEPARSRQ